MRSVTARLTALALFAGFIVIGCGSGASPGKAVAVVGSSPCAATIIVSIAAGSCAAPGPSGQVVAQNPTPPASPSMGGSSPPGSGGTPSSAPIVLTNPGGGKTGLQGTCGSADGGTYDLVYVSSLSRWCVVDSAWQANGAAAYTPFYAFGDAVVTALDDKFGFTPQGLPFTFEAQPSSGSDSAGGHTPGDFGLSDAFTDPIASGTNNGVTHYWGYLFPLHEAINTWTGQISGSWPVDWWADHRSPYPSSMDAFFLQAIGVAMNDQNVQKAGDLKLSEGDCVGSDGCDTETAMFDTFFTTYGGFAPYAKLFKLMQGDGIAWANVAPNPSPLLSEYVIAYLQLAFGTSTDLTPTFVKAGVGTLDTTIPSYTVDPTVVRAVANAHCSIKAAGNTSTALQALQQGKYQTASATGGTQGACPSECLWSVPQNQCTAKW